MQNELKPCPFCGGEPNLYYHDSEIYWTEWYIDCKACGYRMCNKAVGDKAALLEAKKGWNTRQPDFDWKPIEELEELIEVVLFDKNKAYSVGVRVRNKVRVSMLNNSQEEVYLDVPVTYFTHYALLTPPKTNQSNN